MKKVSMLLLVSCLGVGAQINAEDETINSNVSIALNSSADANVTLAHIPESCGLLDQASRCLEEIEHVHFIQEIIKLFSKKKGDTVIFTTENFEELLSKMRELKFTKEEIANFRDHPELCYEKIRSVLEIAAIQADIHLDEETVKLFCSKAATAYSTWDTVDSLLKMFAGFSNPWVSIVGTVGLFVGSSYQLGTKPAVALTSVLIATYMYCRSTVPAI